MRPEVQILEANHPVALICICAYTHTYTMKERNKQTKEEKKERREGGEKEGEKDRQRSREGRERQIHRYLLGTKQICTAPKTA